MSDSIEKKNEANASRLGLPKKWNLIVGQHDGDHRVPEELVEPPTIQPNLNGKIEPAPGNEVKPVEKQIDHELSDSLYKAIWRTLDGSIPISPVRSPVVADWKIVGSPSGSCQKLVDPLEQLIEDEARLREGGSGSLSGLSSVDRTRRMRSASVIGELLSSGGSDLFSQPSSNPSPVQLEEISCQGAQVAQLPTMVREELGLQDEAEATEIFQKSSMESILFDPDEEEGNSVPGSVLARSGSGSDYFKNITFGPGSSSSTGGVFVGAATGGFSASSTGVGLERRRPSYLGLTDWPLSAGAIGSGSGRANVTSGPEAEDDFFAAEPLALPRSGRISRRHSAALVETGLEESFGSMDFFGSAVGGFGSVPRASPPKHDYGYFYDPSPVPASSHAYHPAGSFQLNSYTGPLWAVEFKSGRTEIFYVLEVEGAPQCQCKVGDLVIVEADRGEDLGKITAEISVARMKSFIAGSEDATGTAVDGKPLEKNAISSELAQLLRSKEIIPKRIHRLAQPADMKVLAAKSQEEALAMVRCQSRIRQKKLPMEVVDAEYQWDRNKLTFFFIADRRIDFRELVRDLFRIYKTRIWMCAVDKTSPRMINYLGGLVPVHSADLDDEEEQAPLVKPVGPTQHQPAISYKSVATHEQH